jgi:hypothetical protein
LIALDASTSTALGCARERFERARLPFLCADKSLDHRAIDRFLVGARGANGCDCHAGDEGEDTCDRESGCC